MINTGNKFYGYSNNYIKIGKYNMYTGICDYVYRKCYQCNAFSDKRAVAWIH